MKEKLNEYEEKLTEIISNEKDMRFTYTSIGGSFPMFGMIESKGIGGVEAYQIVVRETDEGRNLFINDFMIFGDSKKEGLEKIIEFNEKVAKELDCSSVSVDAGVSEIIEIYKENGYNFEEGKYIGVKELG